MVAYVLGILAVALALRENEGSGRLVAGILTASWLWMGLVSQAGVTLGLATIIRRAFPTWGLSLETLIVGMITVHEMVGPILFRMSLQRAGEVKESAPARRVAAAAAH